MDERFDEARSILAGGVGPVFPGAVLGCWREGAERVVEAVGATAFPDAPAGGARVAPVDADTSYDLASLTKPLATLPVVLSLCAEGRLDLDAAAGDRIAALRGTRWQDATPLHLMAHVSGLPSWLPLASGVVAASGQGAAGTPGARAAVLDRIASEPGEAPPGVACTYSDPGYVLLALLAEAAGGATLDRLFRERVAGPLGLERTFFVPIRGGRADEPPVPRDRIAATEVCPTRGRCLQGEVHDDNAWVLGGVAGHAGLFSTVRETAAIALAMAASWRGDGRWLPPVLVRRAFSSETTLPGSTRLVAVDTPSPNGSMAGDRPPPGTVGHLGFTGTSFWMQPATGNLVVLLTNRVHPDRARTGIQAFRPRLHDACWRALGQPPR